MQPRRDALVLSEKQLNERQKELKTKLREDKDLEKQLEGLKIH